MNTRPNRPFARRLNARRLTLVLLGLLLIASGRSFAQSDGVVHVTFMDWWGPPRSEAYLEIIALFEARNPTIKVEFIQSSNSHERAQVLAAAGTPVDLVAVNSWAASGLILSGYAEDLTALIERDIPDVRERLIPGALELQMFQGRIYGLPKLFNMSTMAANVDLIDEAGLSVPGYRYTIEEFVGYLQKLSRVDSLGNPQQYGLYTGRA